MPITPTYPGVYTQEIPSGVRTITGVSTSVGAFVGAALRGPIDTPVHIFSFTDYQRSFGDLSPDFELGYGVHQFFLNGGNEAWVVRVAKDVSSATVTLKDAAAANALVVTAREDGLAAGKAGNNIEVRVDYQTSSPTSSFNLTLVYSDPNNASSQVVETFTNLSMNSKSPQYAKTVVNGASNLVTVDRAAGLAIAGAGTSTSSVKAADGAPKVDARHNQIRVSVDGATAVPVTLTSPINAATLENEIQTQVQAVVGPTFTCVADANGFLHLSSTSAKEFTSVRVYPGAANDASTVLGLGALAGGVETDAAGAVRPKEVPNAGTLTGTVVLAAPVVIGATDHTMQISVDGQGPDTLTIPSGSYTLPQLSAAIQSAVQALRAQDGYKFFTASLNATSHLVLTSGSRGAGSSVVVKAAAGDTLATTTLGLDPGTLGATPVATMLAGGFDAPFDPTAPYPVFCPTGRSGIYALDTVDIFNLLCLPGITDASTLIDSAAYCEERMAFLIADPTPNLTPDQFKSLVGGPTMPKSDHGAVYFPRVLIGDPANGGQLRTCAPSGAVAGVYARTDSTRGVWKAPAGTDASLTGVQAMEYVLTDNENGIINPAGGNALRLFPTYGAVVWGARTLQGADAIASEYKYVPVRRLALYLEASLLRGTKWVVFEPNAEPLWSQIRLNIGAFMQTLFRQGAFAGTKPSDAYFVKCDKDTTTPDDVNRGVVNIVVGFAPLKPAEFVIISFQQIAQSPS